MLQLLAAALPAGQTLPPGGSDLPGAPDPASAAPVTNAAPAAALPGANTASGGAVATPADLADLLRLALARSAAAAGTTGTTATAVPDTKPSPATPGASQVTSFATNAGAAPQATPFDLRALLDSNAVAQGPAEPLAALASAARADVVGDTQRRAAPAVAPAQDAAQLAAKDLATADSGAQTAVAVQAPVAAIEAPSVGAKLTRPDDALSLAVVPTAGTDSTAATPPALPPLAHAPTPNAAAAAPSAAPAQGSLPPHLGDAVDMSSKPWHDALATRIQWLVDHDIGEAKIKLNPPELGALDVKISLLDDKTFVQMTAHSASARDELAQGLPRLRELLSAGGLELGGATVSGGHDDRGAFGSAPQPVMRAAPFAATAEALPDSPRPRLGASPAVIDTFA